MDNGDNVEGEPFFLMRNREHAKLSCGEGCYFCNKVILSILLLNITSMVGFFQ